MSKHRFEIGDKVTYAPLGITNGVVLVRLCGYYLLSQKHGVSVVREDAEELRLVEWTTLAELRPGAVFETETGERGVKQLKVKQEGSQWVAVSYVRLGNGESITMLPVGAESLKVRELAIP